MTNAHAYTQIRVLTDVSTVLETRRTSRPIIGAGTGPYGERKAQYDTIAFKEKYDQTFFTHLVFGCDVEATFFQIPFTLLTVEGVVITSYCRS